MKYSEMLQSYKKNKDGLLKFDSYSNDVRLLDNHIIKSFKTVKRLKNCVNGIMTLKGTEINVPNIKYIFMQDKILIEEYIEGITLNEYTIKLSVNEFFEIGKMMARLHNIKVQENLTVNDWTISIRNDIFDIKKCLKNYENDFIESLKKIENLLVKVSKDVELTYVHGDFRPANIIYNPVIKKYYLVDFENFEIGNPMLDIYKMISIIKNIRGYYYEELVSFLNGYLKIRNLPNNFYDKYLFYDLYYSLRSVRRAINDKTFRKNYDEYIVNSDINASGKNIKSIIIANWIRKYLK